jgi:O-antigen/teichoic acid export membrane protein
MGIRIMIAFTLIVASMILDYTLIAAGHPKYLPIISTADTVPSVLANIILIPIFGFMGAVFAKLIANIAAFPVSVWGLYREKIAVRVGEYLKPMLFLMICLGIHVGFGLDRIAFKVLLIVLFLVLCVSFSVVTGRDAASLFRSLRFTIQRPASIK